MLAVGLKASPPPHFQGIFPLHDRTSHPRGEGARCGGEQTTVANGNAVILAA
jgi:hypothetical protein